MPSFACCDCIIQMDWQQCSAAKQEYRQLGGIVPRHHVCFEGGGLSASTKSKPPSCSQLRHPLHSLPFLCCIRTDCGSTPCQMSMRASRV